MRGNSTIWTVLTLMACTAFTISCSNSEAQAQTEPSYLFDPTWPQPLPDNWKMGGVTGLAVDSNGDVWALTRPNDLTSIELQAELTPPISACCVRSPTMIHFDREGRVIGSFDAPQGHGMDVDDEGFVYIGQDTVRKYDPQTGQVVAEVARTPERENGAPVGLRPLPEPVPGQGSAGAVYRFLPPPARPAPARDPEA